MGVLAHAIDAFITCITHASTTGVPCCCVNPTHNYSMTIQHTHAQRYDTNNGDDNTVVVFIHVCIHIIYIYIYIYIYVFIYSTAYCTHGLGIAGVPQTPGTAQTCPHCC